MKVIILSILLLGAGITLNAQTPFVHQAVAGNTTAHITTINRSATNGKPNNLLFVSQFYGKYNDHQIGVWYDDGKWKIYNEDRSPMPATQNFNVLSVSPSDQAFTVTGNAANTTQNWTKIDHPATNNNPNAVLFVTQNFNGKYNPKPIGVYYDGRNWAIYLQDRSPMPAGLRWNVLVGGYGNTSNISGAAVSILTASGANKTNKLGKYIVSTGARDVAQRTFFTQRWGTERTYNNNIPAMWWDGDSWTIFNNNRKEIPDGAGFSLLTFGVNTAQAPNPNPESPPAPPSDLLTKIDLDERGNSITGLNVGYIKQPETGGADIGQVGDKLWAEGGRYRMEFVETGRDADKVYLVEKGGTLKKIINVTARKIETLFDSGPTASPFAQAMERRDVGTDSSPRIRLKTKDIKYTIDGKKSINNSPWKEPKYKYNDGIENIWLREKGGFGNPPNDLYVPVSGHNNLYRDRLNYMEIKGENLFTINGKLYVGYDEVAPAPVRKIENVHRVDKTYKIAYDSNPLDDNQQLNSEFKSELNLRMYTNYYRNGEENKLYVSMGQDQSSLTPSVGGMKWDEGNERGWFLLDLRTKIVPKGIGDRAGLSLDKFGPSTTTLSGTEANSHEISLDVPLDGDAPSASSTVSKTVTVSSDDFRVRTNRNANELDVKYYLAFTKDGGTVREDEPKDLAITVDPTHTTLLKIRANVAELPKKATTSFPIMAHGLWKVNRSFRGTLEINVMIEATYCRMYRKSKYAGPNALLRVSTIKRQFQTSTVIPAMYLEH